MREISYIKINTPCNDLFITYVTIDALTYPIRISFNEPSDRELPVKINLSAFIPENNIPLSTVIDAINDCFSGNINSFDSSKLLRYYNLTEFQKEVYNQLIKVPKGCIITYKQLAHFSGNDKSSRAVGNIMRCNPFVILIPCHRVIKSNGESGGFGGNIPLKIALLAREDIQLNAF